MPRKYPKFLYSNPTNTKSKGPFIVHTLSPQFICRVINTAPHPYSALEKNAKVITEFDLELLDVFTENATEQEIASLTNEMKTWFSHQDFRDA
jgi:hypothetical protein